MVSGSTSHLCECYEIDIAPKIRDDNIAKREGYEERDVPKFSAV